MTSEPVTREDAPGPVGPGPDPGPVADPENPPAPDTGRPQDPETDTEVDPESEGGEV
jgi:hypothetical protein